MNEAKNHKPTLYMVLVIALVLVAAVAFFKYGPVVAGIGVVGAVYCLIHMFKEKTYIKGNISAINKRYDEMLQNGKTVITGTMQDWNKARNVVTEFEQKPLTEIIA